ncbi:hypothetical protein SAMN04487911_1585 [Arenibacter nanhaiticus]|uniref:Uncharacterized protein n=1 Tax=Arenibacter nanhaiticus TaxID=558155 RepID=A0A1M6N8C2_9FLAO|nr:hypothetical protein [Arenibacter nanhaiticus]SHJ91932.1 hypothetical protein SAMN04487911_1585 [Arenibacter nanhaiticus]
MSEFKKSEGCLVEKQSTAIATEKLDAVLNYLNDNRELAYHYGYGLPKRYSKPKEVVLTSQEVLNVLDKLDRDKMVRVKIMGIGNGNSNSAEHYTISLDGEVLLQDGGYTQKLIDERNKKNKIAQDLRISQRNEVFVKWTSLVAAIGAIGILIFEIYKYFLCSY